tara:strand:+ start:1279 stop:1989 length:711 start_codon:yes stop_codon:yes gene_type:complete
MTSYLKSLLGYKNEDIFVNNENDQSKNYEIEKTVSEKQNMNDKRFIEALDLSYFSEKQKNLNLDLDLSFGHLKGKNDLDFKLAFGHLVTPNDLKSEKDFVFKKSKEGYSVFVSSDDDHEDYIVKRIFRDYYESKDFFEKMKLEYPNSMNIELESNLFDTHANFNDEYFDGEILDTYKLLDQYGPYHYDDNCEEIEEERINKKNKDGKELSEEKDEILLKNQYPNFDNFDWKNSTIV